MFGPYFVLQYLVFIISLERRDLIGLPKIGQQCVLVTFPDHTHILIFDLPPLEASFCNGKY